MFPQSRQGCTWRGHTRPNKIFQAWLQRLHLLHKHETSLTVYSHGSVPRTACILLPPPLFFYQALILLSVLHTCISENALRVEVIPAWISILMGCPLCPCFLSLRFHRSEGEVKALRREDRGVGGMNEGEEHRWRNRLLTGRHTWVELGRIIDFYLDGSSVSV